MKIAVIPVYLVTYNMCGVEGRTLKVHAYSPSHAARIVKSKLPYAEVVMASELVA